jgi:thiamine pyrophosphate-dependent acetolactate synthase large subunit-like protein
MGGREVLLEVLRTEGVAHVFGNPGSTELPLIDALAGIDGVRYVLALAEATAVGIAEGHARATGCPAVLSLHTSSGVGVAMDLDDPPVDFVALAESMGVEGTLVEKAVDVGDAVEAAFASGRPHLLELPIAAP